MRHTEWLDIETKPVPIFSSESDQVSSGPLVEEDIVKVET